jgi:hypothetical protein
MLITMAALGIVAFVLFIYIIQNPSTYREASARLIGVAAQLRKNEAALDSLTTKNLQPVSNRLVKIPTSGSSFSTKSARWLLIHNPRN